MSTYEKLGGKTLAELPVPPTNIRVTGGTSTIDVAWDNNNILTGSTNIIQLWNGVTWNDKTELPSGSTSGSITGLTTYGDWNVRISVKLNDRYYPSLPVSTSTSTPYPTTGLIARFAFEDTLDDDEATYTFVPDSSTYSYITGKVSKAVRLTQSPKSMNLIDNALMNAVYYNRHTFTIAYWIYATTDGGFFKVGGNIGTFISVSDGLIVYLRAGGQTSSVSSVTTGWNHVVITYDGSETKVYLNNELKHTLTETDDTTMSTNEYRVYGTTQGLDNTYYYDRVLTEAERNKLYNSGNGI